jgi:hypothetical protein
LANLCAETNTEMIKWMSAIRNFHNCEVPEHYDDKLIKEDDDDEDNMPHHDHSDENNELEQNESKTIADSLDSLE